MLQCAVPTRRDNIELVWSISELTSILGRTTNLDGFLQDVVDSIAEHMQSDVCSVYLLDESVAALVLRATRGLDRSSVGEVKLRLGEGITGTAVKELRPIREARASTNPLYKYIPGTHEEDFESFLAVPIRRGLSRIGALVVQHRKSDHFVRQDTRALQAIAGQLAATLENVEMLVEMRGGHDEVEEEAHDSVDLIACQPATDGVAVGKIVRFRNAEEPAAENLDDGEHEIGEQAFLHALELTDRQITAIHQELDERIADIASLIFGSHLLMLHDSEFSGEMLRSIRAGTPASRAINTTVDRYVTVLSASPNPRTRETAHDIRDLGSRLIRNLRTETEGQGDLRGAVVIAHELFPSDLVRLSAEHAEGLILTGGGTTAHLTILARSLEVPMVLARDEHISSIPDATLVAVDAHDGRIYVDPNESVLATFEAAKAVPKEELAGDIGPTRTSDDELVSLLANINILHDVESAVSAGAEGIGLYRSEFPFLVRNDFPSEDEQFAIYGRIVDRIPQGQIVLRTLDIGGDKVFGESQHLEGNPFLGLRGIRFSLAHQDLFREQLRAILRAGSGRDLRILFPMIASVDEFFAARSTVQDVLLDLAHEGIKHNSKPALGVMIELPSAVECVEDLAKVVDFMSIGSNDLIMYLLAVDRTNEQVEHLYEPRHPAVLRALRRTVTACKNAGISVSICGEAGADPVIASFLIGCGLRTISADPGRLAAIRDVVRSVSASEARELADELCAAGSIEEVRRIVEARQL